MTKFTGLLLLLFGVLTFAQDGTRVYEFVNITTSPRQAALGGNAQSMWDGDPNMSYWNPALASEMSHGFVAFNYINYLADVNFGTLSGVYQYDDYNFFSLHAQYVDYGDFRGYDENDVPTADFTAKDLAISLGYAHRLSDFFTVGASVKYINSRIESYSSQAVAADFGLVFHDVDYNTNVSLAVRNLGFQIQTYAGTKEKMPLQINLGLSQRLEHVPLELSLTLHDLQKFDISMPYDENGNETKFGRKFIDHVSLGAELFPGQGFNLRLGYNFKRGNELKIEDHRTFAGLTYGFGIRINAFRFDFAHANYYKGSNTNHFGLTVNLDRLIQGRNYWRSNPYY
ncbi:MAG: type IX secretion system protein PorQ [Weeksellaceae bacterium]|nr:type IX secretion system protein PorQ [Weeksellaceae bacterium]